MRIQVLPSDSIAQTAGKALTALFAEQNGDPFLFLCSGGSSLSLLEYVDTSHFGPHSTVSVLDERYSTDPHVSNMAQLDQTDFYKRVKDVGTHFIDTKVHERESIDAFAARFDSALREWCDTTSGSIIATIGIGTDAHTAGIMPYPADPQLFDALFNDPAHWVRAYDAEGKNPHRLRVTTTLPFLRRVDSAIVFVTGENKKQALRTLLSDEGSLYESPCRIVREMKDAQVFTDQTV